jgi:hypothetical protein
VIAKFHCNMKTSHPRRKYPDARPYISLGVVAHAAKGEYKVLRLAPQYQGAPEYCVCLEGTVVAHLFEEAVANSVCAHLNQQNQKT